MGVCTCTRTLGAPSIQAGAKTTHGGPGGRLTGPAASKRCHGRGTSFWGSRLGTRPCGWRPREEVRQEQSEPPALSQPGHGPARSSLSPGQLLQGPLRRAPPILPVPTVPGAARYKGPQATMPQEAKWLDQVIPSGPAQRQYRRLRLVLALGDRTVTMADSDMHIQGGSAS